LGGLGGSRLEELVLFEGLVPAGRIQEARLWQPCFSIPVLMAADGRGVISQGQWS
jgi:hypothetical protein